MEKELLFKDLRKYIARFDRINIRKLQNEQVESFSCMGKVPFSYDNFPVANIKREKIILDTFEKTEYEKILSKTKYTDDFVRCIEITIKA